MAHTCEESDENIGRNTLREPNWPDGLLVHGRFPFLKVNSHELHMKASLRTGPFWVITLCIPAATLIAQEKAGPLMGCGDSGSDF